MAVTFTNSDGQTVTLNGSLIKLPQPQKNSYTTTRHGGDGAAFSTAGSYAEETTLLFWQKYDTAANAITARNNFMSQIAGRLCSVSDSVTLQSYTDIAITKCIALPQATRQGTYNARVEYTITMRMTDGVS